MTALQPRALADGRPLQPTAFKEPFCAAGHSNKKMCLFADFLISDPRGKFVVCGSEDHSISFWDVNSKKVCNHDGGVACARLPFNPNAEPGCLMPCSKFKSSMGVHLLRRRARATAPPSSALLPAPSTA